MSINSKKPKPAVKPPSKAELEKDSDFKSPKYKAQSKAAEGKDKPGIAKTK